MSIQQTHHMTVCSTGSALAAPSRTEISAKTSVVHIPPSSKHFLLCPMTSHHATYHWLHGNAREECVDSDQGCLYLIESMNETHEGPYICVSSEDVHQKTYNRTVVQYQLSMSRSDAHRVSPIVLPCLLLLLTAPYFLLQTFKSIIRPKSLISIVLHTIEIVTNRKRVQ